MTQKMATLLTLADLLDATGGRLTAESSSHVTAAAAFGRVVTDSRDVTPGDLLWVLPTTEDRDENFAEHAFTRGAAGVVASYHVAPPSGRWSVKVHDGHWALWQLASAARQRFHGRVVAITGSAGRTSARQMIHAVLRDDHHGVTDPHGFDSPIGVPLSMLAWQSDHHYALLELNAARQGDIDALAALCRPDIGIVAPVDPSQMTGPSSQGAAAESKAELLAALPANGHAILSTDDPWTQSFQRRCHAQLILTGRSADADLMATEVRSDGGRICFDIDRQAFDIPASSRHDLSSALTAIAVGRIFGHDLQAMAAALRDFQAVPPNCSEAKQMGPDRETRPAMTRVA